MESLTSVHIEKYCCHAWAIRGYRGTNSYSNRDPYCFTADVYVESDTSCEIKAALGWLGDGPKSIKTSCIKIYAALAFRGMTHIWGGRKSSMPLAKKIGDRYLIETY